MRVFLAIFPPKEISDLFREYKRQLRKQKQNLTFVPAPDIHLTVKFLGPDVSNNSVQRISDIYENLFREIAPFKLTLNDIYFGFKNESKPRVLQVSVKEAAYLENLVNQVEASVSRFKFKDTYPPKKNFIPHFTLGRIKGNIHWKKINEIREALEIHEFPAKDLEFTVDSLKLMNSIKAKDGQRYEVVRDFKLKRTD